MKKKVVLIILTILLVSICTSALASRISLNPGKSIPAAQRPVYAISSSPTYKVTISGNPGDKVTVYLDLYDNRTGEKIFKSSNSVTGTIGGKNQTTITIKPGKNFGYRDFTTKARLRFTANKNNSNLVYVTYPNP